MILMEEEDSRKYARHTTEDTTLWGRGGWDDEEEGEEGEEGYEGYEGYEDDD